MLQRIGIALAASVGIGSCREPLKTPEASKQALGPAGVVAYSVGTDSSLYTLTKQSFSFPEGDLYRVRIRLTVHNSGRDTLFLVRNCQSSKPDYALLRVDGDSTSVRYNFRSCIHDDPGEPFSVSGGSMLRIDLDLATPATKAARPPVRIEELTGEFVPVLDAYVRGSTADARIFVPPVAVDTFRIVPPSQ